MGYSCKKNGKHWEWEVYNSAYGLIMGRAKTLEEAAVEMAIAESDLFEAPYPKTIVDEMRKDYKKYAKDFPNPIK